MNTFWTCLTQFITTTLSILASSAIAYFTFHFQSKKALSEQKRLQLINQQTALELFRAAIANLLAFLPEINHDFSKNALSLSCDKLKIIESQLNLLNDCELPDLFIPKFQFYKYKISMVLLSLTAIISGTASDFVDANSLADLDIASLIRELKVFISDYSDKAEGK